MSGNGDQPDLFGSTRDVAVAVEPAAPVDTGAETGAGGAPPRAPGALPSIPDGDSLPLSLFAEHAYL
ncbi:MAG: hypothetical protein K2W80_18795, partial [Burkholderiales bacterium]|nr:hypothetical protein [Burkholderiales bacterium]